MTQKQPFSWRSLDVCLQSSKAGGSSWGVSTDRDRVSVVVPGRCSSDTGPARRGRSGCCRRFCLCRCSLPERARGEGWLGVGGGGCRGRGCGGRPLPGPKPKAYRGSKGQANGLCRHSPRGGGKGQNTRLDQVLTFLTGFSKGITASSLQGSHLGKGAVPPTPHQAGSG